MDGVTYTALCVAVIKLLVLYYGFNVLEVIYIYHYGCNILAQDDLAIGAIVILLCV